MLYIRTDNVPPSITIAVDKQQGHYCTITFKHTIDEGKTYVCR